MIVYCRGTGTAMPRSAYLIYLKYAVNTGVSISEDIYPHLFRDFQIKKYTTIYCGVGVSPAHSQRRVRLRRERSVERCPPHKIG